MEAPFVIERISKLHNFKDFSCGEPSLDNYLRNWGVRNTQNDFSTTYVLCPRGTKEVIGYYSLCASSIRSCRLPEVKSAPRNIPTVLLGRIALRHDFRGQGLGEILLIHVFRETLLVSTKISVWGLELDAINESVKQWYQNFGFMEIIDEPLHLYIEIETLRQLEADIWGESIPDLRLT